MEYSESLKAAKRFVDLVEQSRRPKDSDLMRALLGLLSSYHTCPEGCFIPHKIGPPRRNSEKHRKEIEAKFTDFGFYSVAAPLLVGDPDALMAGDAVDDILDITNEMLDAVWYAENVGIDQAHFHFRQMYAHWGEHCLELTRFLFALDNE